MNVSVIDILKNISKFNIAGWADLKEDQVKICKVGDGYMNFTCRVERLNDEDESCGPKSLVYKVYGGSMATDIMAVTMRVNSPFMQSYLFAELSNRAWGPKLYGILEEPFGRIEEFIDCHTLRHGEAFEDEQLSADVAKAYARFHSLKLPIPNRKAEFCMDVIHKNMQEKLDKLREWSKNVELKDGRKDLDALLEFDIMEENDWIVRNCENISHRTVLCNMDPSYLNRLVRNEKPTDDTMTRSIIIDLDLTTYSHRGFDLGGHFSTRLFDWSNLHQLESGYSLPTEEQKDHFLRSYLAECKELFDDFDEKCLDSLEQLKMEVDLYSAIYLFWLISFGLSIPLIYEKMDFFPSHYGPAIKGYRCLKKQFCEKYPHVAC